MLSEFSVSFPLELCKAILELEDDQNWRSYRASVSHGAPGRKSGSIHTRVVSEQAGDKFVDLLFKFPRANPRIFTSKGKARLRFENVKYVPELQEASGSESRNELAGKQTQSVADDTPARQTSRELATDGQVPGLGFSRRKYARERKANANTAETPVFETDISGRPSRRKGRPARFRDYDTDLDDNQKPNIAPTTVPQTETAVIPTASEAVFSANTVTVEYATVQDSFQSQGEIQIASYPSKPKKRKRYGKLIQKLTQASQQYSKSEAEIESILSTLKASINPEIEQDPDSSDSFTRSGEMVSASDASTVSDSISHPVDAAAAGAVTKSSPSTTKQTQGKRSTHPHLTSFPRKFPSVLLSTSSGYSTVSPQSTSVDNEAVNRVLKTYKKIQPAGQTLRHRIEEDYADDDSDPDYEPSDGDSAGYTRTSKRKTSLRRLSVASRTTESGQSLQTLDASDVKPGVHFFIPQLRVVQDGVESSEKSVALVGPFRVVGEGDAAHLELVPQAERDNRTPAVLKGDLSLPSGIVKGITATASVIKWQEAGKPQQFGKHGAFSSVILDHDYTDVNKPVIAGPKVLKTLMKPISLTQHITARVEKVEESEGNSLVTISGHNYQASPVPDCMYLTPKLHASGMPVVDSLEEVMTDTLKRIEKYRESYRQAMEAKPTQPVYVSLAEMSVAGEVVLTAEGQVHSSKISKTPGRKRSRRQTSEHDVDTLDLSNTDGGVTGCDSDTVVAVSVNGNIQVLAQGDGNSDVYFTQLGEESLGQGLIGANFRPGETVYLSESDQNLEDSQTASPDMSNNDTVVEIENADEVDSSNLPALESNFCNYCLRLFPSAYLLLNHVKSVHSAYSSNPEHVEYLESLKRGARVLCPYCPGKQYLSNSYKYFVHLNNFHKDQTDSSSTSLSEVTLHQCEICMVRFQTLGSLNLHAARKHNLQLSACPLCQQCFIQRSSRDAHIKDVHGDSVSTLSCSDCGDVFQRKGQLVAHHKQTHGERMEQGAHDVHEATDVDLLEQEQEQLGAHACHLCSKSFKSPVTLSRHFETKHQEFDARGISHQRGRARIKCTCCLARFQSLGEMQEHKRHVHTGAIPVHCVFCGSGYQSTAPMYTHIKNHHIRTQSFSCSICSKQFNNRQLLERHLYLSHQVQSAELLERLSSEAKHDEMMSSSGGTRICCPYCREVFSKETSLVAHIVEGHREQFPHTCPHCEQNFLTVKALNHHLQGAHEVNTPGLSPPASPSPLILRQSVTVPTISDDSAAMDQVSAAQFPSSSSSALPCQQDPSSNTDVFSSLPAEAQSYIRSINNRGKRAMLIIDDGKGGVRELSFSPSETKHLNPHASPSVDTAENIQYYENVDENAPVAGEPVAAETQVAIENLVHGMEMPTEGGEEYWQISVVETADGQFISGSEIGTQGAELVVEESMPVELDDVSTVTVETSSSDTVTISAEDLLKLFKESQSSLK